MPPNSQAALDELRAFQGARRKSQDILKDSEVRLGVPKAAERKAGLRTAITNTENLIRAVEPSVSGRTGGSLVTEAQKSRLIGLERAPLDEAFREQSRAYEGESALEQELRARALQESQLQLAEDDRREQALSGIYGTLYQREQDAIAKAERDRAAAEQQRQASAWSNIFNSNSASTTPQSVSAPVSPTTTTSNGITDVEREAYRRIKELEGKSDRELLSDLRATSLSAQNGNAIDQFKLRLFAQKYPYLVNGTGKKNVFERAGATVSNAANSLGERLTRGISGALRGF